MPDDAPPTPPRRFSALAACAAMLLASAAMTYRGALKESPTCDEPLHAASGFLIRWTGDYRIDVEDPALFTLLSSLPNRSGDLHVDERDPMLVGLLANHDSQMDLVVKMMFRTPRPEGGVYSGPGFINRSRVVFTLIFIILGVLISWWAYRLAGWPAALIACGLLAFDPNFLAHGSLVKNDVPMALLMLWLAHAIWRFGQRGTLMRLASMALACAVAVNVKFSAPILCAILVCALTARAISVGAWPIFGRELCSRAARLAAAAGACVIVSLVCWGTIWTVYGFRFSIAPDPAVKFDPTPFVREAKLRELARTGDLFTEEQVAAQPAPVAVRLILWLDEHRLFPDAWLFGLLYTYTKSLARDTFLLGAHALTGWWYYFPAAMLFKTPLATLLGILVLIARFLRLQFRAKPQAEKAPADFATRWTRLCLWLPIVIYGFFAMTANLNLGLRHILPIYPFIYLLIGSVAAKSRVLRRFAAVVVIAAAAESLANWPHEIAFFNVACGGARGGINLLGDSNLDWGQDLPLLAQWQREHTDRRLYLAYFGVSDPAWYGIRFLHVSGGSDVFTEQPAVPLSKPGVFAISATYLQGIYWSDAARQNLAFLRQRSPIAVLGGSIYLYDWDPLEFAAWRAAPPRP